MPSLKRILITGGAGFIGRALVRSLADSGAYRIAVLDNLSAQVHGPDARFSEGLLGFATCRRGDVNDQRALMEALRGQEVVVHLAAETGTGQSMYEISRYTQVNVQGTALLLDCCRQAGDCVKKIVLASSRAVYGEGRTHCASCGVVYPGQRTRDDMERGQFALRCPMCGRPVSALATNEDSPLCPTSIYGVTKASQEQLLDVFRKSSEASAVALRFQNVYGPGQSLQNPYTGVLSIFSNLILAGEEINLFEDGAEGRDFVFIDDVVQAIRLAIEGDDLPCYAYNVGTGSLTSIAEVSERLMESLGQNVPARISGDFRLGDIRHCFADLTRSKRDLGYEAAWALVDGIQRFCEWVKGQGQNTSKFSQSIDELKDNDILLSSRKGDTDGE